VERGEVQDAQRDALLVLDGAGRDQRLLLGRDRRLQVAPGPGLPAGPNVLLLGQESRARGPGGRPAASGRFSEREGQQREQGSANV